MPDMTPVGTMYPPTNPLQSLSSILGIQQQRQQLQLQAQELQRSQIDTQQASGVNQFFSSVPPAELHDAQGNISADMAHQRPEYQALPGVARVAVDQKINQLQAQQLANKQALTTMNGDLVSQFGKTAQAASQLPPDQAQDLLTKWGQQGPENQRILALYQKPLQGTPPQHLPDALRAIGAQAQDVTAQQAQTNPEVTPISTGGTTQLYNVNKASGIQPGQQPAATVRNTLAPAQQLSYLGPAAAASAGGAAAATGEVGADRTRANEVGALQQESSAAIPLSQQADRLKDMLDNGTLAKKISETGNYLGFSSVNEARAQLNNDLGKMRGLVAQRAGSDTRANEILTGYPTDTTPTNTFHADMDYFRGAARQNIARGQLLSQYQASDPQAVKGFQAADNVLTRTTNPLMHEYLALKPEQQAGFYRRNFQTPQEAQAFKDQVSALKKHTSVLGQ